MNYTPTTLGHRVEKKLQMEVWQRERLNATGIDNQHTDGLTKIFWYLFLLEAE
jgi:hypothetical protein